MSEAKFSIQSEDEMLQLGEVLAKNCEPGAVIFLQGDLGVGKTTLVRGVLRSLGHVGAVKSPTYTLVEQYDLSDKTFFHFDLYRLTSPEELEYIGGRDYFRDNTISFIEWPMNADGYLPEADLTITIEYQGMAHRNIQLQGCTASGERMLDRMIRDRGLHSAHKLTS